MVSRHLRSRGVKVGWGKTVWRFGGKTKLNQLKILGILLILLILFKIKPSRENGSRFNGFWFGGKTELNQLKILGILRSFGCAQDKSF